MKLAIMQPYIFPYIGYFHLVQATDTFVFYDDVNFKKRSWINRNNILVNSQAKLFSIPLIGASQNSLINAVAVDNNSQWKTKFLKTIELAYKKAPNFSEVYQLVSEILEPNYSNIGELAAASIMKCSKFMGLERNWVFSSKKYSNTHLKAQNRILDICLEEKTTHYINVLAGMELYTTELFDSKSIKLDFIKSSPSSYPQFSGDPIKYLSIIDVLMFNSGEQVQTLLNEYQLASKEVWSIQPNES